MQRKIFFNFVVVLLVGVIISGFLSVRIIQEHYNDIIERRLISNAFLIRELEGERLIKYAGADMDDYLRRVKGLVNSRITIIDSEGKVLGDTEKDWSAMDNHSGRPEIVAAYNGQTGISKRYSQTLGVDLLYIALPIYTNGEIQGVLRLSNPLYEINQLVSKLYVGAIISIFTGLLVASLLGYRMAANITKPVKEMTIVAADISKGQFEKRIILNSRDEMGQLASSINYMASTLNETISSIKEKNIRMEAILSGVVNGIIAVDSAKRILFINPVAASLLGIEDISVTGKHILQVIRNNQLDDQLKSIINENDYIDTELLISFPEEKILKIYANPIRYMEKEDDIGIIIIIQDISELRKLEKMRSEFVANVSHELKTPLTSIKGFVETLKNGALEDEETSIRFLNIIEDEADRLNRLISDILSLSELENRRTRYMIDSIDVKSVISEVVSMLSNQAEKKSIDLSFTAADNLRMIYGERDNLKQMLINLIDNAVKYTPEGGRVEVHTINQDNRIVIVIKDNGIGIPKEHIPRLFERFYRVDKARSRKVGGTGLGLAIVKHIVKLFDGEIEVESTVGKGTKFTIILPIE